MPNSEFNLPESYILEACDADNVHSNVPVWNCATSSPVVHIHVDPSILRTCRLLNVCEVKNKDQLVVYTFDELNRPWVDIHFPSLNLCPGMHTYRMEFVNTVTGDSIFQYFAYVIQTDIPCKPYIYMNRTR